MVRGVPSTVDHQTFSDLKSERVVSVGRDVRKVNLGGILWRDEPGERR